MKVPMVLLAAALATTAAAAYVSFSPERGTLTIPTTLESTAIGGTVQGPGGLVVSPSVVAFGKLRPGSDSAPVTLTVQNAGALPLTVSMTSSPMTDPASGVSFPADALTITRSATGALVPGGSVQLTLQLSVPSGADQWIPAGAYAGSITLHYEEGGL